MKYKIGTLVQLSAAGHKRDHNPDFSAKEYEIKKVKIPKSKKNKNNS